MMLTKQKLFIHLLLFSMFLSLGLCYCGGSFSGTYETCTFYYGYQDPNCTLYQFDQCQWTECVSYVTVGNDTYCAAYQTFSDNHWVSCSNRCCLKQFPNQYASFQQCDDNVKAVILNILAIIFAVIGGIVGVVIIICLICKCRDQLSSCCSSIGDCCSSIGDCFRALGEGLCYILTCGCIRSLTYRANNPQSKQNIELSIEELSKWMTENVRNERLNETCCICLEPSPSLQLGCGHIYHRTCIIAYLAKKEECALCRNTNIQRVKVYCENCFSRSCTLNIKESHERLKSKQQFCDLCKENHL